MVINQPTCLIPYSEQHNYWFMLEFYIIITLICQHRFKDERSTLIQCCKTDLTAKQCQAMTPTKSAMCCICSPFLI